MQEIKGSFRRNGTAIQVSTVLASAVKDGDTVAFNRRPFTVTSRGRPFDTAQGMQQYLYVAPKEQEPDAAQRFHLKENHRAKGREVELAKHSSIYCEPVILLVEIKPRNRVVTCRLSSLGTGSRGWVGVAHFTLAIPFSPGDGVEIAAKAFLAGDNAALLALSDAAQERTNKFPVSQLARFVELAQQADPYSYIRQQLRERKYADCRFKVGDKVRFVSSYGIRDDRRKGEVLAVRFDDVYPYGWRVGIAGVDAPQDQFVPIEDPATTQRA